MMTRELEPPAASARRRDWLHWIWLVGRMQQRGHLQALKDVILNDGLDEELRKVAVSSYWELVNVDEAILVQNLLIDRQEMVLALYAVNHPKWWHDVQWLDASRHWIGRTDILDAWLKRLWSWTEESTTVARIPREVYHRANAFEEYRGNWGQAWTRGLELLERMPLEGFHAFWPVHIGQWADHFRQWEEATCRYRWRLEEEQALVALTRSDAYITPHIEEPEVDLIVTSEARPPGELLTILILGWGDLVVKDAQGAALWDSIWASWAASLQYMIFEISSNIQTTEWHIAGLTGALRDDISVTQWRLNLD